MPLGMEVLASAQATLCWMGTQPLSLKGGGAPSPILRVEVENLEIGP